VDGKNPFSISPGEQRDLRNLFKIISTGGNPYSYPELKDVYNQYKTIFDIFDICIDTRYGNIINLPFSGGIVDQGSKTMEMIRYLQSLFRKKIIQDENQRNNLKK
jgi:hypothetical protein